VYILVNNLKGQTHVNTLKESVLTSKDTHLITMTNLALQEKFPYLFREKQFTWSRLVLSSNHRCLPNYPCQHVTKQVLKKIICYYWL